MTAGYPAFPSDLPIAPLKKISYKKLLEQDAAESTRLLEATETDGFFQLDLSDGPAGLQHAEDVDKMFDLCQAFFEQSMDDKMAFFGERNGIGFQPVGFTEIGGGLRDLVELCGVPRDSVRDPKVTPSLPPIFDAHRALLAHMSIELQGIASTLLAHLSKQLDLPTTRLLQLHNEAEPSATAFRFLHHPPQKEKPRTSLPGHTDSGTLTILFTRLGGLQVLPPAGTEAELAQPEEGRWRYVRPEPGCAIINLGDPLVQWSGGIVRSTFHRVTGAPGEQGKHDRYVWGYFLKPADNGTMTRITDGDSAVIPRMTEEDLRDESGMPLYENWHRKKAIGYMVGRNDVKSLGGIRKWTLAGQS